MNMKIVKKPSSVCNCINLRRASLTLSEVYDEFLKPSGLKISQFSLLKHLKRLGPVNVSELAEKMRLDRTTLVRNLKPLEEQGLISDISIIGARNRQLTLNDTGHAKLEEAEQLWLQAQDYVEQYLGKEDMITLTGLLSKIEALTP